MRIPRVVRKSYRFVRSIKDYLYDHLCFLNESMVLDYSKSEDSFLGNITLRAHVVEKGLTMPNMRPNFGHGNLVDLIAKCIEYSEKYDTTKPLFASAVSVIKEYKEVHECLCEKIPSDILCLIEKVYELFPNIEASRQPIKTKDETFYHGDFYYVAHHRVTNRNFSGPVNSENLQLALMLAMTAPSACNRQPVRVFVLSKGDSVFDAVLNLQHGNRGFGNLADKLLVVTSKFDSYIDFHERNAMYVDGGIFVMNLLYALQYYGISACTLNSSFTAKEERHFKKLICTNNALIAMIAIGDCKEEFKVAKSQRRDISEIIQYI